jgi:hypothetical protein
MAAATWRWIVRLRSAIAASTYALATTAASWALNAVTPTSTMLLWLRGATSTDADDARSPASCLAASRTAGEPRNCAAVTTGSLWVESRRRPLIPTNAGVSAESGVTTTCACAS